MKLRLISLFEDEKMTGLPGMIVKNIPGGKLYGLKGEKFQSGNFQNFMKMMKRIDLLRPVVHLVKQALGQGVRVEKSSKSEAAYLSNKGVRVRVAVHEPNPRNRSSFNDIWLNPLASGYSPSKAKELILTALEKVKRNPSAKMYKFNLYPNVIAEKTEEPIFESVTEDYKLSKTGKQGYTISTDFGYLQFKIKDGKATSLNIEIFPEYRDQGKSKELLQHFKEVLKDKSIDTIESTIISKWALKARLRMFPDSEILDSDTGEGISYEDLMDEDIDKHGHWEDRSNVLVRSKI